MVEATVLFCATTIAYVAEPAIAHSREMHSLLLQAAEEEGEDGEEEGNERGETFSDYRPSKLALGIDHPDPVVETASLAAVRLPVHSHTSQCMMVTLGCCNVFGPCQQACLQRLQLLLCAKENQSFGMATHKAQPTWLPCFPVPLAL